MSEQRKKFENHGGAYIKKSKAGNTYLSVGVLKADLDEADTVTGRAYLVHGHHQRLGAGPSAAARFRSSPVRDGHFHFLRPQTEAQ